MSTKQGNQRRNKNRNKKVVVVRPKVGLAAESTRSNIMVIAQCVPRSVEAMFCALFTRACIFKGNSLSSPLYWAYYAFMNDLRQIMGSQIPASGARLRYLNDILATYVPKNIPFKADSELVYSWGNINTVATLNLITVRGYNYYMWVNSGTTAGLWEEQTPPSAPSTDDEAFDKLAQTYTLVAANLEGLTVDSKDAVLSKRYKNDVSGFTAAAPYYGQGNGENGPCYSCESEVPYKAPLLSGVAQYDRTRVARQFYMTAGDTTAAFGLPFLPNFKTRYFDTTVPPIYKFIDIDEFVYLIQVWYCKMVSAYASSIISNAIPLNEDVVFALSPFDISPEEFRTYWRQIILNMFAASQACAQFITYSSDPQGFEPLRVGSNCYPPNVTGIQLPQLIVENFRLLQTKIYVESKGSQKDALLMIPVLGIYKSVENSPYNVIGTFYNGVEGTISPYSSQICVGVNQSGIYPRMVDGLGNNNVPLFLNGDNLSAFIDEWNTRFNIIKAASLKSGILAGESSGSLLNLTRYCRYSEVEVNVSNLPHYMARKFPKEKLVEKTIERMKPRELKKTNSIKDVAEKKEIFFVPKGFDLYTQKTTAISSLTPISETLKTVCQYMVLPSLYIESDGSPPLQRQVRVQNMEGFVWDWEPDTGTGYTSQANRLDNFAAICAPGIAANNIDELSDVVSNMNNRGEGGFVGDILKGVIDFFGW